MLLIIDRTGKLVSPTEDAVHVALATTKGVRLTHTPSTDVLAFAYLTKVYDPQGHYYALEVCYPEAIEQRFDSADEAVEQFLEVMKDGKVTQGHSQ